MTKNGTGKVEELIANPESYFNTPRDVLRRTGLSDRERLSILKAMELDAKELSVASAENMPGDGRGSTADRLADVRDAIRELEGRTDE